MYLKHLELAGFKSFAKKEQLDFKTPITAIVGPNGSGKSNIAEAFRFVLGEQSMKSMRSKRTEDLIWNGSGNVPRASRGRAALTFDNRTHGGSKLFDVDFDEVTVERLIHRDASSEYKVNGSQVRLKDIVDMLGHAHIGASGHHIISQGETDRILSVNPKDRKAMIDDALGLRIYQYKKEEAIRKLEKTEENTKEVSSQRREIKPHLKFLEKQVEKIEKARTLREELIKKYQLYFAVEKRYLQETAVRVAREKKERHEELARVEAELASVKKDRHEDEADQKLYQELEQIEKQLTDVRGAKEAIQREAGRIEGQLAAVLEIEGGAENETISVPTVATFLDVLEKEIDTVGEDESTWRSLVTTIRERIHTFRKEVFGTQKEEAAQARRTELEQRKEENARELTERTQEEDSCKKRRAEIQQMLSDKQKAGREADRAFYELRSKQSDVSARVAMIEREEQELERAQEEFQEEEREARVLAGPDAFAKPDHVEELTDEAKMALRKDVERLKIRLEEAGAGSGADVLAEYESVKERDALLERELNDLDVSKQKLVDIIANLDEELAREFRRGVEKINSAFQEFFALMFGGGTAKLVLVKEPKRSRSELDFAIFGKEEEAEFEDGLDISVSLPRKKIRGLEMLSGGERALTSVALLFAMSRVNPPPFLLLDETDAALDEANSKRYGDMIERLAEHSQLILITHNRETMSRAGVLYGVTMGKDSASQLLSVDFEEAVSVAK